MQTNIKSLFIVAAALSALTSCSDFLTEDNKMGLTEEQI